MSNHPPRFAGLGFAAIALFSFANPGLAQPVGNADRDARAAYSNAITCFTANGHARGLRVRAGDPDKAAVYEAHAHDAWSAAFKLGKSLGLANGRIEQDISKSESDELPTMVNNQEAFLHDVAMCKGLGLM